MAQAIRTPRYSARPVAAGQHITRSDLSEHPRRFRGRHHAATIFVIALLAVVGFRLFPARDVTVIKDGQAYRVATTFNPASEGLAAADVNLDPGDRVLVGAGGRYASIAIDRAHAVHVSADGTSIAVRTQAATVGGALAAAGVYLHPGDRVYVGGHLATRQAPLVAALPARPGTIASQVGPDTDKAIDVSVVRARPVTVWVDTLRIDTASAAPSVSELLAELGMTVREGDLVQPGLDQPLAAGATVRLAKARTVSVRIDGQEQSLYTLAETVADVLAVLAIEPGPADVVSLPLDTPVVNGLVLTIGLTRTVVEEVATAVAPGTRYETDTSLAPGAVRVIPGRDGVMVTRYAVTYHNGEEVGRVEAARDVVQSAVPTVQLSGPPASSSSHPPAATIETPEFRGSFRAKLTVRATWYNAQHGGKDRSNPAYGLTSTGIFVDRGVCAVDPAVIPMHTVFFVPGYGRCVAADVGGGVKGNHIDLGFPEDAGDSPWATRDVEIFILD